MAAPRDPLTPKDLALAMAEPARGQVDLFVGGVAGLSVRRGSRGASWVLRGRVAGAGTVKTWTLAGFDDLNLRQARERAAAALQMARDGQDPAGWLAGLSGAVRRETKPGPPAARPSVPYREAVDAFLREKAGTTVPETVRSYRSDLLHSALLEAFETTDDIAPEALQRVLDGLTKRGKRVQAVNSRRNLLTFLRWSATAPSIRFSRDRIADLESETAVGQASRKVARAQKAEKLPTVDALAGFWWRLDASAAPAHMKLGLALLGLTGQRIKTLREARTAWFSGGLWDIPGASMKSGRDHALPLGPFGAAVGDALVRAAPTDPSGAGLLFPGRHPEEEGDPGPRPMTYRPFNELCHEALGTSLHPLRHALATYGETRVGIERLTLQAVMDHTERSTFEKAYSHERRMELMRDALARWEAWLLSISRRDGHLPRFLPSVP